MDSLGGNGLESRRRQDEKIPPHPKRASGEYFYSVSRLLHAYPSSPGHVRGSLPARPLGSLSESITSICARESSKSLASRFSTRRSRREDFGMMTMSFCIRYRSATCPSDRSSWAAIALLSGLLRILPRASGAHACVTIPCFL